MKVEIWSDVVCPWCYIGKRRFEAALARFDHRRQVEVLWRSFELDPGARSAAAGGGGPDYADRLAAKYATTRAGAQQMLDSMTLAAAREGLDFRFDLAPAVNTFDAHRVIHLAGDRGLQDQVKERLLRAYFTEGRAVGDRTVLVRLAAEAGLDAADVERALSTQQYADRVRADEAEAAALGINGVPFFVVDRTYGAPGHSRTRSSCTSSSGPGARGAPGSPWSAPTAPTPAAPTAARSEGRPMAGPPPNAPQGRQDGGPGRSAPTGPVAPSSRKRRWVLPPSRHGVA